jgi:hypothetical protein
LFLIVFMAPEVGLEPTTLRLTAECSAIELLRSVAISRRWRAASNPSYNKQPAGRSKWLHAASHHIENAQR